MTGAEDPLPAAPEQTAAARSQLLLAAPVVSSAAIACIGWLLTALAGQDARAASVWLCLPVAVAGGVGGPRAALVVSAGASAAVVAVTGSLPLPQVLLLLLLGQVVALVVGRARAADRALLTALEEEREQAILAFADRDALSQRLTHQARHDMLTGLPNRALFLERLHEALRAASADQTIGVLFLDLDDFKTVNDSLGHSAGDELLVGVSRRLDNTLRTGDLIARFGGDEFAALLLGGGTPEQVVGVANRLLGVLRAPFALASGMASGLASGGLVLDSRDSVRSVKEQGADLMRQADLAMYAAKADGGGRCVEFRPELQEAVLERLTLQDEITQALINEDFSLAYQPVLNLETQELVAVEALVRWNHPERGPIPPSQFIPIAERSGAIVPLGLWVLEQACQDLQLWDELCPGNGLRVSVNISARQLRDRSVGPQIARVLHRGGVDPRRLILEVTESLLMDDGETATATLWQLRALGIRIAVDDFGTGYSSLSRLVDLPLDDLKIDRSFIAELDRSDAGATIVNAAIAMAHGLGLKVVAEGIESADQLAFLVAAGADHGQGFLFSPPVAHDAVLGMLRRGAGLAHRRVPARPGPAVPLPARPTPTILPSLPRHR